MLFRFALVAVSALSWALFPVSASACSRAEPWTQQTIYNEAKEVFRARVTKVELSDYVETGALTKDRFDRAMLALRQLATVNVGWIPNDRIKSTLSEYLCKLDTPIQRTDLGVRISLAIFWFD